MFKKSGNFILPFFVDQEFSKIFFRLKFRFLTKISIFGQNYDFLPTFPLLTKLSIVDKYFDFWPNFRWLAKSSIFDRFDYFSKKSFFPIFDYWPKFWFLANISIFNKILIKKNNFLSILLKVHILQFCS